MAQVPEQLIMAGPAVPFPQPANTDTRDNKRVSFYNCKAARATGAIQVICGVLAIIFEFITSLPWLSQYGEDKALVGVWGGALFIACGIIGLLSAKKKRGMIVTYLVLSIICSVVAGIGLLFAIPKIAYAHYDFYDHRSTNLTYVSCLIISMICEMLTGIVASAFGCASRICCAASPIIHERVIYMAPPGPPHAYSGPTVVMALPTAYTACPPTDGIIEKQPIP